MAARGTNCGMRWFKASVQRGRAGKKLAKNWGWRTSRPPGTTEKELGPVSKIGNLGEDPEMRYTPGGSAVAKFTN